MIVTGASVATVICTFVDTTRLASYGASAAKKVVVLATNAMKCTIPKTGCKQGAQV